MSSFIIPDSLNKSIDYPLGEEILSVGYYSIVAFLAIFGNIFIIYATSKVRARSVDGMTIILIKVLAINDLVGGAILYPHFIFLLSKGHFPFSATYCIILGMCEIYFPLISTLLVMTLVLTKVAMIRNPFLALKDSRMIYLFLPPIFLVGTIAPLGVFINLGHYMFSPERGTCTYQFYPSLLKEKIFIMTCTSLFVIIPLCIILCMSLYILRFMKEMRAKSKSIMEQNCQTHKVKVKVLKSVLIVLLVVMSYVICWSMFFCVTTISFMIGGEESVPRQILLWQKALLMTNNAVNPFVYVAGNKRLQSVIKHLVYRVRGLNVVDVRDNFSTIVQENNRLQAVGKTMSIAMRFTRELSNATKPPGPRPIKRVNRRLDLRSIVENPKFPKLGKVPLSSSELDRSTTSMSNCSVTIKLDLELKEQCAEIKDFVAGSMSNDCLSPSVAVTDEESCNGSDWVNENPDDVVNANGGPHSHYGAV